jgi:hypothetical protein
VEASNQPTLLDLADVDLRRILGAEHRGPDPGPARIGGERSTGIAVGRHRHVGDAERLRHRHRHHQAARLERAGRQTPLVLDDDLAAAELLRQVRQPHQRRQRFAETDDVGDLAHRKQFAITPDVRRSPAKRVLAQGTANACEIIAHEQRLAGRRQPMDLVGLKSFAGIGALQMRDEGGPFGTQILVVVHSASHAPGQVRRDDRR